MSEERCARCVLPRTFPGLHFNDQGLCHHCQAAPPPNEVKAFRAGLTAQVEAAIEERRAQGSYDCVVALSGGKDSTYTLLRLVEDYGLNCIAVTIDNGFLAEEAIANCRKVTAELGVDHIFFTPNRQFMTNMYRTSATGERLHSPSALTRASAICNSCISLINAQMMRIAQQYGSGIIAGGYIGGQVPKDSAVMVLNPAKHDRLRKQTVDRMNERFGLSADRYFSYSLGNGDESREIAVINPMLGYVIAEEEIIEAIKPLGWRRPQRTGITSTNCLLNDFGVYTHHKKLGFHPYALEIAEQVRSGELSREEGLRKIKTIPEREDIEDLAEAIGVSADEF